MCIIPENESAANQVMPIIDGVTVHSIDMFQLRPFEDFAMRQYGRSLDKIASHRGGLTVKEAVELVIYGYTNRQDLLVRSTERGLRITYPCNGAVPDTDWEEFLRNLSVIEIRRPSEVDLANLAATKQETSSAGLNNWSDCTITVSEVMAANHDTIVGNPFPVAHLRIAKCEVTGREQLQQMWHTPLLGGGAQKSWRVVPTVTVPEGEIK